MNITNDATLKRNFQCRHVNGNVEGGDEETDEEVEAEEASSKPPKVENNMNARRWKWEILDN